MGFFFYIFKHFAKSPVFKIKNNAGMGHPIISHIAHFSRRMSKWEPTSQGTAYPSQKDVQRMNLTNVLWRALWVQPVHVIQKSVIGLYIYQATKYFVLTLRWEWRKNTPKNIDYKTLFEPKHGLFTENLCCTNRN